MAYKRKRVLVTFPATTLDRILGGLDSNVGEQATPTQDSSAVEQAVLMQDRIVDTEQQDVKSIIKPDDVVIPMCEANRLAANKRMAVIRMANAWLSSRRRELVVQSGVPEDQIISGDLVGVTVAPEDAEYYSTMMQVSIIVGALDYGASDMQNFEPPGPLDIDGWINDVPDQFFDTLVYAGVVLNPHWVASQKNQILPG